MGRRTTVEPVFENCSLAELRAAARCARDIREHRRMLCIIMLGNGMGREAILDVLGVGEATMRRWIHAFNRAGIDGLLSRPRAGRPSKIAGETGAALKEALEDPARAGRSHWTGRKVHGYLRSDLGGEASYATVLRWMHSQDYRLRVPQPWPDRQDEELRKEFCSQVGKWLGDKEIELWYLDESGVEGNPRPRRRWARKGERCRATRNGDHLRASAVGMVCPRTGEFYALEFDGVDGQVFQCFLDHANRDTARGRKRELLICDNASWHKCRHLDWGRFEPVFLPPYSPDLNPIERLWLLLKAEFFVGFATDDMDVLLDRLAEGLNWLVGRAADNVTTCRIKTHA